MKRKAKNNTAMTKTNLTITLNEPGWEEQIPDLQQLANNVLVNALEYVEANEDIDFSALKTGRHQPLSQ